MYCNPLPIPGVNRMFEDKSEWLFEKVHTLLKGMGWGRYFVQTQKSKVFKIRDSPFAVSELGSAPNMFPDTNGYSRGGPKAIDTLILEASHPKTAKFFLPKQFLSVTLSSCKWVTENGIRK